MMDLRDDFIAFADSIGELVNVRVVLRDADVVRDFDGNTSAPTETVYNVWGVIAPVEDGRDPGETGTRRVDSRIYYLERFDGFELRLDDAVKGRLWLDDQYLGQSVVAWKSVYQINAIRPDKSTGAPS